MNIIGISSPDGTDADAKRVLARTSARLSGEIRKFETTIPGFGAAVYAHTFDDVGPQPFISNDGRYIGFALGELYADTGGTRDLQALFNHFVTHGFLGWERINGQHILVVFDKQSNTTHIANDRFGFRPLYYTVVSGTLYFSARILSLIEALPFRPALSQQGLAELLLFGHHFGQGCLFTGIKCLPPASLLSFKGGEASVKRYWKIRYEPEANLSIADLVDLLTVAIGRQAIGGGRMGVLLSGGLDSRVVAYGAIKSARDIQAFTFGDPGTADVVYAKDVSSRLRIEHHHLAFEASAWKRSLPQVALAAEGEANIEHFRSIQFHQRMESRCDTILTGLSGDMIMGSTVKPDHLRTMADSEIADYAFRFSLQNAAKRLRDILSKERWEKLESICREVIRESFSGNVNELGADRLCAWNIENRQRRLILMGPHTDRIRFNVRSPFFDYDLFDYSLKIPGEKRLNESMYLHALWSMMPELHEVPWQKTGVVPNPSWEFMLARKVLVRAKQKLGLAPRKAYVEVGTLVRQGFNADELRNILAGQTRRWHEFVDRIAINTIVEQHYSKSRDHGSLIMTLLTLAYAEDGLPRDALYDHP